jgi:hypothetical protein
VCRAQSATHSTVANRRRPTGTVGRLAFAGRVFPDATLRGMRMSRSHGGTVPIVFDWNLSSEASSPGSDASCRKRLAGRGADTPANPILRVGTVTTGTAPTFGRTLAPRYGSDLLTLRLLSLLQWGDALFRAAPVEEVDGLCQARSLPAITLPLRALLVRASRAFWRGGPAGKRNCVLVCAVATKTLWGNCVHERIETPRSRDSALARFLIAPRRSAPDSC